MGAATGVLPPSHTLPPPSPSLAEVAGGGRNRRGPSNCHQLPPHHTLPPPSPSWAEVAGGGGGERRGQPAVCGTRAPSSHHAPRPSPPSATTQFESWLLCRREGIPAKLVLETDGVSEEVSLWFRRTPCAPTEPPPPRRRRHRPGRHRRRRLRKVEGLQTAQSNAPPASAEATAAEENGPDPPKMSEVEASPPSGSPPAKRPRTRAAAREGRCQDPPTPEMSRVSGFAGPCALDISFGAELYEQRDLSPPPPTPPTSPPPTPPAPPPPTPPSEAAEVQDFLYAWAVGGYDEKELEVGVRDRGGWRKVNDIIFPVLPAVPMRCRFCKTFDINLGFDDDLCMETDDHCGKCTLADDIDTVKYFAFHCNFH